MQLHFTDEASGSYTIPLPLHSSINSWTEENFRVHTQPQCGFSRALPSLPKVALGPARHGPPNASLDIRSIKNRVACSAEESTQRRFRDDRLVRTLLGLHRSYEPCPLTHGHSSGLQLLNTAVVGIKGKRYDRKSIRRLEPKLASRRSKRRRGQTIILCASSGLSSVGQGPRLRASYLYTGGLYRVVGECKPVISIPLLVGWDMNRGLRCRLGSNALHKLLGRRK